MVVQHENGLQHYQTVGVALGMERCTFFESLKIDLLRRTFAEVPFDPDVHASPHYFRQDAYYCGDGPNWTNFLADNDGWLPPPLLLTDDGVAALLPASLIKDARDGGDTVRLKEGVTRLIERAVKGDDLLSLAQWATVLAVLAVAIADDEEESLTWTTPIHYRLSQGLLPILQEIHHRVLQIGSNT